MSLPLSTIRHLWRRPSWRQWSRLERDLAGSTLAVRALDIEDQHAATDSSEMRHYLAAQTSQVV